MGCTRWFILQLPSALLCLNGIGYTRYAPFSHTKTPLLERGVKGAE